MTEEHENTSWGTDMYFASTDLPQLEGFADVSWALQARLALVVGPSGSIQLTVSAEGVSVL